MVERKKARRALTIAELEGINYSTGNGARAIAAQLAKLAILATDAHRVARLAVNRCRACEYLSGSRLAGQAFSAWKCRLCGDDQPMHPNTAVPRLCAGCAKSYGLCVTCGGDIETRHRGRRTGRKATRGATSQDAPPPAAQEPPARAVVVGSVWRGPSGDVRITHVYAGMVDYIYIGSRIVGGGTSAAHTFVNDFTWVSDPKEGEREP